MLYTTIILQCSIRILQRFLVVGKVYKSNQLFPTLPPKCFYVPLPGPMEDGLVQLDAGGSSRGNPRK
jgi:hypothetical protein